MEASNGGGMRKFAKVDISVSEMSYRGLEARVTREAQSGCSDWVSETEVLRHSVE